MEVERICGKEREDQGKKAERDGIGHGNKVAQVASKLNRSRARSKKPRRLGGAFVWAQVVAVSDQ